MEISKQKRSRKNNKKWLDALKNNKNKYIIYQTKEKGDNAKMHTFQYKQGEKVKGVVKNIKPYGAFIKLDGGTVGLAHIEDLSIARIKTPYERLQIGQKVDVIVKNVEEDTGRITLSYKETLGTWEENASKFEKGMKTKGIVRQTEKNKNGIFIELTPNLVGMAEYEEGLEYGKTVDVLIKKIDKEKKKVKLLIV